MGVESRERESPVRFASARCADSAWTVKPIAAVAWKLWRCLPTLNRLPHRHDDAVEAQPSVPPKPASASVEPLTAQALIWLLAALALAVAPHARELPIWLIALFAGVSGWRGYIVIRNRNLLPRCALPILAVAAGRGLAGIPHPARLRRGLRC